MEKGSLVLRGIIFEKFGERLYRHGKRLYNKQGLEICGVKNRHGKHCSRLGQCPFHHRRQSRQLSLPRNVVQDAIQVVDPNSNIGEKFKKTWTEKEHNLFLEGLKMFGRGHWKEISEMIPNRTPSQVQSHAQKYFFRIGSHKPKSNTRRRAGFSHAPPVVRKSPRRAVRADRDEDHIFSPLTVSSYCSSTPSPEILTSSASPARHPPRRRRRVIPLMGLCLTSPRPARPVSEIRTDTCVMFKNENGRIAVRLL
eukprot:gnl/Chilomastix_cuspidata/5475.p1 GENE.gnl/Chilomastix_cuspidata/5475~~gnl/Chilomastix_cuspidata/5475.p1  ORF type:complete len:253 (-),score=22.10 gnl/Chilomastix_cuspidata/5475:272-1030(-)